MASNYPSEYDVFTLPNSGDKATPSHAELHRNTSQAIEAIQATLGLNPQNPNDTVAARLAAIQAQIREGNLPSGGATDTALLKVSGTSFDSEWVDLGWVAMSRLPTVLASVAGWEVGDPIRKIRLIPGEYEIDAAIRVPSGVHLDLTGSTIRLADAANCDIITNADWTGDSDITIEGGFLDGNRTGQETTVGDGPGQSLISLVNVERGTVRNVHGTAPYLHGVDLANQDYHTANDEPGCSHILVEGCVFSDFGDDGISTHFSNAITIANCRLYDSAGTYSAGSHGIEIDDGSYDVTVIGCLAENCDSGFQVQGHPDRQAARSVSFQNCISVNNTRGFCATKSDGAGDDPADQVTWDGIIRGCDVAFRIDNYRSAHLSGLVADCTNLLSTASTSSTLTRHVVFENMTVLRTRTLLNLTNISKLTFNNVHWRGYDGTAGVAVAQDDVELIGCTVMDGVNDFSGALQLYSTARTKVIGGEYRSIGGPGIRVETVTDCIISGVTASGSNSAGGIYFPSSATITDLIMTECVSVGGNRGIYILTDAGTAIIKHCIAKGSTTTISEAPEGWIVEENFS